ncbi:MAG: S41 family peptidase [Ignavibacteriae bacterium]|nr:S41 family peptidase [Ignavibacteriota bacterium]
MRKRFSLLSVSLIIVLSLVAGAWLNQLISGDNIYDQLNKFKDVLSMAQKVYVEDVDTGKLTEAAIRGMLGELDPHSVYISSAEMQRVKEDFQGSFEGIGIEFAVLNDTLVVVTPIIGGPSEALGIEAGDKIVKIDDTSSVGITQEAVPKKLRGPKGTKVRVAIARAGIKDLLQFEITRDKIPLYTVDASFMVDDEVGYVSVTRFAATTQSEFVEAVSKLKREGMKRLVLDLRFNGGGYLDQAFKMVDELLPKGKKVVYTKGRRPEFNEEYISSGSARVADVGLVVLVNNASASASEIVSGAVQDWDRGLVVGETTFGKGLVQRQYDLTDGSGFRLTTARYYTPSGRLIQRPYGEDKVKYQREAFERNEEEGENITHSAEKDSARPKFKTAGGRVVYGGGGITPDYIVKGERLGEYAVQLRAKQVYLDFANKYLDTHGAAIRQKYGADSRKFAKDFEITDEILETINSMAKNKGVEFKKEAYDKDVRFVKLLAKASIARSIWGNVGSSRVTLLDDNQFKKAISLFPEAEKISKSLTSLK